MADTKALSSNTVKVGDAVKWYEELRRPSGPRAPQLCEGVVIEVLPLGMLVEDMASHSPVYVKYHWVTECTASSR